MIGVFLLSLLMILTSCSRLYRELGTTEENQATIKPPQDGFSFSDLEE
jgi:hypothetical protein